MEFHRSHHRLSQMEKHKSFLSFFIIIPILLLSSWPVSLQSFGLLAVEHDWNIKLGKLRAEALDRLFPRVKETLEAIDPFGIGFVDYRDPLELISYVTLYLPGTLFMLNVLFHMLPQVLTFLLFVPKLWFFNLPCLYSFNTSPLKRGGRKMRRKRNDVLLFNEVTTVSPCDSVNLAHITHLVYKGLVKLMGNDERA